MNQQVVSPDTVVSLREFGRQHDVSLRAVQKAVDAGRVTAVVRNAKGHLSGILLNEAWAQWKRNTDPVEAAKNGQTTAAPAPIATAGPATDLVELAQRGPEQAAPAPAEADQGPEYQKHRAEREMFAAMSARRDWLLSIGALTPTADVQKAAYNAARKVQEQLLAIPDRMASTLAAMTDPAGVHDTLTKELKRVLHELSRGNDTAGGAGAGG